MHRAAAIRPPGPDVHDGLTIQVDRQRAAAEPASGKQLGEAADRAGEVGVSRPLNTMRERCAAVPDLRVRHNVLNLPGTPANKPSGTDPLTHGPCAARG